MVTEILGGKAPSVLSFAAAIAVAVGLTAILLVIATRLFSSEKIVFGR